MAPRKRRRVFIAPPSPETTPQHQPRGEDDEPLPTLPHEILLELVARSDVTTLVRCAACCKALRRDILCPKFIHRVCREPAGNAAVVPPCVLGFLHAYDKAMMEPPCTPPVPFSVAHPTATTPHFEKQLARFVSRTAAAGLLGEYEPLTSRHGLVVLRRRYLELGKFRWPPDICVYDPMSGNRTFLPRAPDIRYMEASMYGRRYTYVLLTTADGIDIVGGCSFLLLAADFTMNYHRSEIVVQTVSSDTADGTWGPLTSTTYPRLRWSDPQPDSSAVVLGGFIHWLMYNALHVLHGGLEDYHVLAYDVRTATARSIRLPDDGVPADCRVSNLHLASSVDRLTLYIADRRNKISAWLLLPAGDGWSRHAVIDIEVTVKSLVAPEFPHYWWLKNVVDFASSGTRSGAILLRPFLKMIAEIEPETEGEEGLVVLDMETKKMHRVNRKKHITVFPFEIDLEARLLAMKTF